MRIIKKISSCVILQAISFIASSKATLAQSTASSPYRYDDFLTMGTLPISQQQQIPNPLFSLIKNAVILPLVVLTVCMTAIFIWRKSSKNNPTAAIPLLVVSWVALAIALTANHFLTNAIEETVNESERLSSDMTLGIPAIVYGCIFLLVAVNLWRLRRHRAKTPKDQNLPH